MDCTFGFIIKSKNKYLICHLFGNSWGPGSWSIPKGHAKSGENALQAALRETMEETNFDLRDMKGKISKIGTFVYPSKRKRITVFLFEGKDSLRFKKGTCMSLISQDEYKGKPEIDLCTWVSFNDASSKLHPSASEALNVIKDK